MRPSAQAVVAFVLIILVLAYAARTGLHVRGRTSSEGSSQQYDPGLLALHYADQFGHYQNGFAYMNQVALKPNKMMNTALGDPGVMPFGFPPGFVQPGMATSQTFGMQMYRDPHAVLGSSLLGYAPFGQGGDMNPISSALGSADYGTGTNVPVTDGLNTPYDSTDSMYPNHAVFPAALVGPSGIDAGQYSTFLFPSSNPEYPAAAAPYRIPTPVWTEPDLSIL
eukprot:gnl/Spiro4/11395_TR6016_c0_g1_i1.p1 gnl/Spiro4/11395_TR6016_c0_g1~~gnl/Spiro4/11395_TR6016_c0_g1_i1.p1  ORF type:complete len:223 (+),score=44.87 gnl/Spiro4/11395_TR6016_c0_g1_i1:91-759(+)